jgi:pyruvate formate lyase activating enzyme
VEGLIFDIQGHSVHDGPGCRTLIFLSGCPLRCFWCANPEGTSVRRHLMVRQSRCTCAPRRCMEQCPSRAIALRDGMVTFDRSHCDICETFECVGACYEEALEICGRYCSIEDLMKHIERDRGFWGPGGGITLSGGDPLCQHEFSRSLLKACQERYIHTAIETSAFAPTEIFLSLMAFVEWAFIDIKHMDPLKHLEGTGASNERILANIKALKKSSWQGRLVMRVPVIPGFNDDTLNIQTTADFLSDLNIEEAHLVPFHRLGESKYRSLGMNYEAATCEPLSKASLLQLQRIFETRSLTCYIGHDTPF